jgi:hypothetical protein
LLDVSDLALSRIASTGSVDIAAVAVAGAGLANAGGGRVGEVHDCGKAPGAGEREGWVSDGAGERVGVRAAGADSAVESSSAVAGETVVGSGATAGPAGGVAVDDVASHQGVAILNSQAHHHASGRPRADAASGVAGEDGSRVGDSSVEAAADGGALAIGVDVGRPASEATGAVVAGEAVAHAGIAVASRGIVALAALVAAVDGAGDAVVVAAGRAGVGSLRVGAQRTTADSVDQYLSSRAAHLALEVRINSETARAGRALGRTSALANQTVLG